MKIIHATKGFRVLVDDEDYEWLSAYNWIAYILKNKNYVQANMRNGHRGSPLVPMHRLILGLKRGDGLEADHIDGNGLNNQKHNLRACTHKQNCQYTRKQSRLTASKYKGVTFRAVCPKRPWWAYIKKDGKQIGLGFYKKEIDAAKAYDKKAEELFGEFAWQNLKHGLAA